MHRPDTVRLVDLDTPLFMRPGPISGGIVYDGPTITMPAGHRRPRLLAALNADGRLAGRVRAGRRAEPARGLAGEGLVCVPDDDVVAGGHRLAERSARAGVAVRHAAAEPGRVDVAGARRRARHRGSASGPGVLVPTLRHPMTNAAATATLVDAGAGAGRGVVRHGVHRPAGDGLPSDPVVVHDRVHRGLHRHCSRRDRRVGGRPDADAPPRRQRRRRGRSTCRSSSGRSDRRAAPSPTARRRRVRDDHAGGPRARRVRLGRVPRTGARCSTTDEDAVVGASPRRRRPGRRARVPRHVRALRAATRSANYRAVSSGSPSSTSARSRSATSTSTSATASTSTPRTGPPGRPPAARCPQTTVTGTADEVGRASTLGEHGVTESCQPCADVRRELEAMFAAAST